MKETISIIDQSGDYVFGVLDGLKMALPEHTVRLVREPCSRHCTIELSPLSKSAPIAVPLNAPPVAAQGEAQRLANNIASRIAQDWNELALMDEKSRGISLYQKACTVAGLIGVDVASLDAGDAETEMEEGRCDLCGVSTIYKDVVTGSFRCEDCVPY